jgi:hypothetical protein
MEKHVLLISVSTSWKAQKQTDLAILTKVNQSDNKSKKKSHFSERNIIDTWGSHETMVHTCVPGCNTAGICRQTPTFRTAHYFHFQSFNHYVPPKRRFLRTSPHVLQPRRPTPTSIYTWDTWWKQNVVARAYTIRLLAPQNRKVKLIMPWSSDRLTFTAWSAQIETTKESTGATETFAASSAITQTNPYPYVYKTGNRK